MVAGGTDAAEGGGTGGAGDGLVPVDDTGTDPLEEVVPVRFVVTDNQPSPKLVAFAFSMATSEVSS